MCMINQEIRMWSKFSYLAICQHGAFNNSGGQIYLRTHMNIMPIFCISALFVYILVWYLKCIQRISCVTVWFIGGIGEVEMLVGMYFSKFPIFIFCAILQFDWTGKRSIYKVEISGYFCRNLLFVKLKLVKSEIPSNISTFPIHTCILWKSANEYCNLLFKILKLFP